MRKNQAGVRDSSGGPSFLATSSSNASRGPCPLSRGRGRGSLLGQASGWRGATASLYNFCKQCILGPTAVLLAPATRTVVLRTVESVCASDGNCAAALPTSKNCSPLLRRVALDMVHEAQGIIFIGYFYESSHRNLHKTQNLNHQLLSTVLRTSVSQEGPPLSESQPMYPTHPCCSLRARTLAARAVRTVGLV